MGLDESGFESRRLNGIMYRVIQYKNIEVCVRIFFGTFDRKIRPGYIVVMKTEKPKKKQEKIATWNTSNSQQQKSRYRELAFARASQTGNLYSSNLVIILKTRMSWILFICFSFSRIELSMGEQKSRSWWRCGLPTCLSGFSRLWFAWTFKKADAEAIVD